MKLKKVTALLLAAVMVMSAAACGQESTEKTDSSVTEEQTGEAAEEQAEETTEEQTEETAEGITFPLEEPVTVSVMNLYFEDVKMETTDVWKAYEEMTNVHFEHTEVTAAEADEKINLKLASGDYPDVFFKTGIDVNKYGMEGVLIPLEDLIRENAPTLTGILDELDLWGEITAPDGHVYGLPAIGSPGLNGWYFRYNKKWLDNLGLECPTNVDELYECLKAIKEQDANGNGDPDDEIPITFASNGFTLQSLTMYLCEDGVSDFWNWLSYNGNEVSYLPATEEFKEFLATCSKWYAEGLIDEKALTQPYDDIYSIAKSQDQYGFFFGGGSIGGDDRSSEYHVVPAFENMKGVPANSGIKSQSAIAITDKCEDPALMIAWADYWYTEEGSLMADLGIEGTHWQWDADGYTQKLDERSGVQYRITGGAYVPYYLPAELQMKYESVKDPATAHKTIGEFDLIANSGVRMPKMSMSEDQTERYSDLKANIGPYVENYMAKVVVGDTDLDATWEEFQAELEKMGVAEMLQIAVDSMPEGYVAAQ